MNFHDLADVHTAGYTVGVKNNVDGSAVGKEGHVFNRQNLTDNTLVTVAARELITGLNTTLLGDVHTHEFINSRG